MTIRTSVPAMTALTAVLLAGTAACDDADRSALRPDGALDAGEVVCRDDRFGLSRPNLPAADLEAGSYADLRLCGPGGDWFAVVAGPGFPVRVTVTAALPVRVVLRGQDDEQLAGGQGTAVELSAWNQPELRLGIQPPEQALDVAYELTLTAAVSEDPCVDGFDVTREAALPATGGRTGVACGGRADTLTVPTAAGTRRTLQVIHAGDGPGVVEIWEAAPTLVVRRSATPLPVAGRLSLPLATARSSVVLVLRAAGDTGRVVYHAALVGEGVPAPIRRIAGRVLVVDRPLTEAGLGDAVPWIAPALVVDVEDAQDVPLGAAVVDAQGGFDFEVAGQGPLILRARAEVVTDRSWIRVGPGPGDAPWAVPLAALEGADALDLDLQVPASDPLAGALHVAATAAAGLARIEPLLPVHVIRDPPLQVHWQPGLASACGTCFRPGALPTVELSGADADPDEWDDFVILHELGHYVMAQYSHDDSPGGAHDGSPVTPVLAWSEGVAHYHAGWQLETPRLLDAKATGVQVIDLEAMPDPRAMGTADDSLGGDLSEYLVAALLWDLTDDPDPDDEPAALPPARLFETLFGWAMTSPTPDRGAPGVDLVDLLATLVCHPDRPAGWAEAVEARDLPFDQTVCAGKAGAAVRLARVGDHVRATVAADGWLALAAGASRRALQVRRGQVVRWRPPADAGWVGATLTRRGHRGEVALPWARVERRPAAWHVVAGCPELDRRTLVSAPRPSHGTSGPSAP